MNPLHAVATTAPTKPCSAISSPASNAPPRSRPRTRVVVDARSALPHFDWTGAYVLNDPGSHTSAAFDAVDRHRRKALAEHLGVRLARLEARA